MDKGYCLNREGVVFKDRFLQIFFQLMKNYFKGWNGVSMLQVCCDDIVQSTVTVKMKVIGSAQQVHGEDQSHQTKIMVTMKVRDEDMVDAMQIYLIAHELHLRPFSAIDQKITIPDFYQL